MRRRQQSHVIAAAACAALAAFVPSRAAHAQYQAPSGTYNAPATYYNNATGTSNATLRPQLNTIVKTGFTSISYDGAKTSIPVLDRDPANPSNVLLVYSGYSVQGEWSLNGTIWNREHVWCNSYGLLDSGVDYSDCFNLRPADPGVNTDRNNEYYDDVPVANRVIGNADSPECYENNLFGDQANNQMWEPRPVEKGDLARGLFYMDVRYDGTDSNTMDLQLTDNVNLIVSNAPYMGKLSTLLKWHYQDGINEEERRRNDVIYDSYQHNRNPFVDRPEMVWAIFGGGANNSKIYVGASAPANGASTTTANLRVIKGAGGWGTTNVTINKAGVHPTTYDLTTGGSATSTAAGTGQSFDYDAQTRSIAVSLNGSTAAVGTVTGTVTINNTDLTTSGVGTGTGSDDGNDTITVNGTVLDFAQPSFVSGATGTAQTMDFGYVPVNGLLRSANFNVWNNAAPAGAAFTASLDVDGASKTGSSLMSTTVTPSNPATPLAPNASRAYIASYTPGAAEGLISATHTIATSDENIPGAAARANLVLMTTGRTTAGGFPVTGNLFLFGSENFTTTSFSVGNGATVTKQGPGTMTVAGVNSHGATAHFIADSGGAVNFTTDANSTAASGLKVTVNAAPVTFSSTQHLRALEVNGVATVAQHGGHPVVTGTLNVAPGGRIDVKDNDLIVNNGSAGSATAGVYSGVQGEVQRGFNGGVWNGNGIVTSMPDAAGGLTSIGVGTAEQVKGIGPTDTDTWNGQTVTGTDVLAMYTYAGDANLDGQITGDDYSAIDFAIQVPGTDGWSNGDFNYDGGITGDDYSAIDFNLLAQGAPLGSAGAVTSAASVVAVPEPASLALIGLAAPLLARRKRRG
jgi:endonuclease I